MTTMAPGLRKLVLTTHVTCSVGWLGAVGSFLALALVGLTSHDDQRARAVYVAMDVVAWFMILPLSLASPATGIVQSLATRWGLFRHYWVLIKLLMTIPSCLFLLVHMRPIGHIARMAAASTLASGELGALRLKLAVNAGAAILVLLVATMLSIYKPRGLTRYGQRREREVNR
ncbi:MAG: rane protein [Myxococcaceae bacterium]|nr:rane protein [Myxococcaceae bacterium]